MQYILIHLLLVIYSQRVVM